MEFDIIDLGPFRKIKFSRKHQNICFLSFFEAENVKMNSENNAKYSKVRMMKTIYGKELHQLPNIFFSH